MLIWAAAGVAAAGAMWYLFGQKAGGGIQNALQDKANEGLTPAPAEEKPCGCGMHK